ncbi:hypothetical protein HNQ35_000483 [Cerasibacillus quisquiliarum]|uniref:Lipoprotein n=1 Tax=Cerasibacillus quisquiliarum TaxID=227865 RepID=A0A511UT93_9BACI|nr:hypothetical protein [Cerasibacillus quisquiliarum]MBB5145294.1 hypothetical protein [Cerasibacillus quisquiliarum]GEN29815.1 hypothetical protein CQU01_00530 [Cerasibacillus quisquiliarum]
MKKDFLTTSILLLIISFLVGCSSHEKTEMNPDYAGVGTEIPGGIDARIVPFDFEEAVKDADLIAEVEIKRLIKEVKEEPIPYTVFATHIIQKIEGDDMRAEVTIRQNGDSEWRFNDNKMFKPGEKYVFFLKKTAASESDYWILGEETGMFQVASDDYLIKLSDSLDEFASLEAHPNDLQSNDKEIINDVTQILDKQSFINKIKGELK